MEFSFVQHLSLLNNSFISQSQDLRHLIKSCGESKENFKSFFL